MNRSIVRFLIAKLLLIEAALLVVPLIVALIYQEDAKVFASILGTMGILLFLGVLGTLFKPKNYHIYTKEGMLIVALCWVLWSFFGGLPFVFAGQIPSAGVLLGFAPLYCVFLLLVFALTLYLTSMISFSSVTAAIVGLITLAVFPAIHFLLDGYDLIFTGVLTIMALIIIFRHTENMGRIRRHQENLVPFGLNLTKQNPNK